MASINLYNFMIKEAEVEIENCRALIGSLENLSNNCTNCSSQLNSAYNALSAGVSEASINGKIANIATRADFIRALASKSGNAIDLVNARIKELESKIAEWRYQKQLLWLRTQKQSYSKGVVSPDMKVRREIM